MNEIVLGKMSVKQAKIIIFKFAETGLKDIRFIYDKSTSHDNLIYLVKLSRSLGCVDITVSLDSPITPSFKKTLTRSGVSNIKVVK